MSARVVRPSRFILHVALSVENRIAQRSDPRAELFRNVLNSRFHLPEDRPKVVNQRRNFLRCCEDKGRGVVPKGGTTLRYRPRGVRVTLVDTDLSKIHDPVILVVH